MASEVRKTLCNRDCPDVCSIVATVEDGRITRLAGDKDHPVTRGFLCYRTNHFLARQYDPARLTTPLMRAHKNGPHLPVSWDEALDVAAAQLTTIRRESGPAAIFHYRSGGSLGLLKFLSDHFFEQFGPVTTKRGDICSGAGDAAQMIDFGVEESHDLFDLHNSRHILLWGKNVFTSSPHLIPVLKAARQRGARLVLIDPVHHRTASLCDRTIKPRPGADFAFAMAVARLLFDEGWTDAAAPGYCDHWEELRALCCTRTMSQWCAEADVTPDEALDVARCLGPGKPTAILVGWGLGRRGSGAGTIRALDALGAISGNLGLPGGGVSYYFKRRGAFDHSLVRGPAAAPRTVCEPLFGPEIESMSDPPIRAVWVTAGNPVAMLPQSETTARALATRDFVVVVDSWMSDTARLADLVLPTTTLLEADDLVGSYGHHFIGAVQPVVPPPDGVRSDLEILQGLAGRVGLGAVMAGSARQWKQRFLRPELAAHGVTLERLEAGAVVNPLVDKVLFADHKFATPSGRVNLLTEAPPSSPRSDERPLQLLSLSTEKSQASQWAQPQDGPAQLTVHPDSAAGIADGALCRVESAIGSLVVRLHHDPDQRRDVALIPKGGGLRDGRCANALIRAATTDAGDGGALYDETVRLLPI